LLAVFDERADFRYVSDIAPSAETLATLKAKHATRLYVTPVKLGAQTGEANVNAGLAAARQIVAFFENGERRFIVNP
jgi:D-3-phosphoglycerate dehydrogenase